jgi:hypothetical protein
VTEFSPTSETPSIDFLREVAARQGVTVADEDLVGVVGFLEVVLPRLAELEQRLPPGTQP